MKNFLRPTSSKITLTIVLSLFLLLIILFTGTDTEANLSSTLLFMLVFGGLGFYLGALLPVAVFIFPLLQNYLLSCLAVFIYQKIEKMKQA